MRLVEIALDGPPRFDQVVIQVSYYGRQMGPCYDKGPYQMLWITTRWNWPNLLVILAIVVACLWAIATFGF